MTSSLHVKLVVFVVGTLVLLLGISIGLAFSNQDASRYPVAPVTTVTPSPTVMPGVTITNIPSPSEHQYIREGECSDDADCGGGCNKCHNNRCVNVCNSDEEIEQCTNDKECPQLACPEYDECVERAQLSGINCEPIAIGCSRYQCIGGSCQLIIPQ